VVTGIDFVILRRRVPGAVNEKQYEALTNKGISIPSRPHRECTAVVAAWRAWPLRIVGGRAWDGGVPEVDRCARERPCRVVVLVVARRPDVDHECGSGPRL
jgi:hypothetical protein